MRYVSVGIYACNATNTVDSRVEQNLRFNVAVVEMAVEPIGPRVRSCLDHSMIVLADLVEPLLAAVGAVVAVLPVDAA